jgi:hypothetical protein
MENMLDHRSLKEVKKSAAAVPAQFSCENAGFMHSAAPTT